MPRVELFSPHMHSTRRLWGEKYRSLKLTREDHTKNVQVEIKQKYETETPPPPQKNFFSLNNYRAEFKLGVELKL